MKTMPLNSTVLALLTAGSLLAQAPATPPVPLPPGYSTTVPASPSPRQVQPAPQPVLPPSTSAPAPRPLAPPVAAEQLVYVDPATGEPTTHEHRFDFDFPGGAPADFIRVVSEARGKPVNAIVPDDLADTRLPEMHLKQVTVPQLFEALEAASRKTVMYKTGGRFGFGQNRENLNYSAMETSFGFRSRGPINDNSIWTFYYEKPNLPTESAPARAVRFYQLGPYLDSYKIDDITTAIQTGWKMLGETSPPTMNFHKETKLLIAVGEPAQLQIIEEVLSQLATGAGTPRPAMTTGRRLSLPPPQPQPPLPAPAQ